jgi:DNA mismatch endonuclease (patch repair protein)
MPRKVISALYKNHSTLPIKRYYIRDGRSPIPKKAITSDIMSRVRGKNTKPELLFRKELRAQGLTDYKLHPKALPGRPDVFFPKKRLAIFINGCFWHRCPYCKPSSPKTHVAFWQNKFNKNIARDKVKRALLRKQGIRSIVLWECQVKKRAEKLVAKLRPTLCA